MRSVQDIMKGQNGRFHGIWLKEVIKEKTKTVPYFCSIECRLFNLLITIYIVMERSSQYIIY